MSRRPPQLAVALVERFVSDPALAGDLIEEFQRGRSARWFWWQALVAIAASSRMPDELRPLRLVDLPPLETLERALAMSRRVQPVNLTASPVHGVGGLGLLVLAFLVTMIVPGLWWALLASMLAGCALGGVMIAIDRRKAR